MTGWSTTIEPDRRNNLRYAQESDRAECRRLHRRFGTTYYFSSLAFPVELRKRVDALYGFVRVPDEWVDNPGSESLDDVRFRLEAYRAELLNGLNGTCPSHAVLRAFCDLVHEVQMPVAEPLLFLAAMEADLSVDRYPTYESLRGYMRGSAAAVGMMMCYVLEVRPDPKTYAAAQALGEAMQLTNFLRDVGEDARRGRIYLPLEDLAKFGITEREILDGVLSNRFYDLMRFEIERARSLYEVADEGIPSLPIAAQRSVKLARVLYSRILDRIEQMDYNVFSRRARTTAREKLGAAYRVWIQTRRK